MADPPKVRNPYDELLKNGSVILKSLNPSAKFDPGNCPEVAAAVHHYLDGRPVSAVRTRIVQGDFVLNAADHGQKRTARHLIQELKKQGHGHHVVVGATAGKRQHWMVIANIRAKIYYLDAYTQPPVMTDKVAEYLSWAKSLTVYKKFDVKFVPR